MTDVQGIGDVSAATILSIVDDPTRFATKGHFAAFTGTAPIAASSGDVQRHRLSRRGNRQMNKVLHTAAKTQIRLGGPGRIYTTKSARKARAPWRHCARSSGSCPTWSTAGCSPTSRCERPGVDR